MGQNTKRLLKLLIVEVVVLQMAGSLWNGLSAKAKLFVHEWRLYLGAFARSLVARF